MSRVLVACTMVSLFLWPISTFAYFTNFERLPSNTLGMGDWTPPITTIAVNGRQIVETIVNGNFEDGLNNWITSGNVEFDQQNIATIGRAEGTMLVDNSLAQDVPNITKTLSFEYRVTTTETLPGFDDPCFTVSMNDRLLFAINSSDIAGEGQRDTDWQRANIDISNSGDPILHLKFSAGNTGDAQNQSWVELRNITTNVLVGNAHDLVSLHATDNFDGRPTSYFTDCDQNILSDSSQLSLTDHDPCDISYWAEDHSQNIEKPNVIRSDIAITPPSFVQNLTATAEPTGELSLHFVIPEKLSLMSYRVLYSDDPIAADQDLTSLRAVDQANISDHFPVPAKNNQLVISSPSDGEHYLVEGKDQHGNVFYFSEI
jgi:hypothetical protein